MFAQVAVAHTPQSADQTAAIRDLRRCVMQLNAARDADRGNEAGCESRTMTYEQATPMTEDWNGSERRIRDAHHLDVEITLGSDTFKVSGFGLFDCHLLEAFEAWLVAVKGNDVDLLAQLRALVEQGAHMATTVADLQAGIDKLTADVAAETDVITGVETAVSGLVALSAAQKAQIADLIAQLGAGNPVTEAQLQALLDSTNATDAAVLAAKDRLSAAVVSGTPAA